eukprot:tig00000760_g3922.t1
MRASGEAPDHLTFAALIRSLCAAGRVDEARAVFFDSIPAAGLAANAHCYAALVKGLGAAGRYEEAFDLYARMREAGIQPTFVLYSILLKLHWQRAKEEGGAAREACLAEARAVALEVRTRGVEVRHGPPSRPRPQTRS